MSRAQAAIHVGDQSQVTQSDRGSCCLTGPRSQEGLSCPPCAPPCPPPWQAHASWGPSTFLMSHVRMRQMLLIPMQAGLPPPPPARPRACSGHAAGGQTPGQPGFRVASWPVTWGPGGCRKSIGHLWTLPLAG